LFLVSPGKQKIQVIKPVRDATRSGLAETKDL
jgi:ribosomal protein L7/L12